MLEGSESFDLTRFSEANRRHLYDRIAEIQFASPERSPTADQSGLQVVYLAGRWFAAWRDLDEPPALPDHLRVRIVRIGVKPDHPAGIELHEV
ncbi:MAG TPA: hypothetical protein VKK31_07680 [Thermoanaerobaculia bacterium]|nr:hypothetical protein [Thermoanaerobaculia bacterium]